ncbi:MAG: hypothetical protein K0S41_2056 [Anaerocolumna sp.]|jgi:hypothetical protein|nr:hypothetical protein [Anaerocolumna sp.]
MQLINVTDEKVKDTLLSKKFNLINTIEDIHKNKIWIFDYNPSLFCLDINDENYKGKCYFSNSSKMTFVERR